MDYFDRSPELENSLKIKDKVDRLEKVKGFQRKLTLFNCLNLLADAGGEIQLTDTLKVLSDQEAIYACMFNGARYNAGDKLSYLKATVDMH